MKHLPIALGGLLVACAPAQRDSAAPESTLAQPVAPPQVCIDHDAPPDLDVTEQWTQLRTWFALPATVTQRTDLPPAMDREMFCKRPPPMLSLSAAAAVASEPLSGLREAERPPTLEVAARPLPTRALEPSGVPFSLAARQNGDELEIKVDPGLRRDSGIKVESAWLLDTVGEPSVVIQMATRSSDLPMPDDERRAVIVTAPAAAHVHLIVLMRDDAGSDILVREEDGAPVKIFHQRWDWGLLAARLHRAEARK